MSSSGFQILGVPFSSYRKPSSKMSLRRAASTASAVCSSTFARNACHAFWEMDLDAVLISASVQLKPVAGSEDSFSKGT